MDLINIDTYHPIEYWIDWFLGIRGNEYFCDLDIEYITDRFNLTGLNTEVEHLQWVIDLITDNYSMFLCYQLHFITTLLLTYTTSFFNYSG